MESIVNLLGINSNDPVIICNRSLSVIDCISTKLFKSGDNFAAHLDDETKANLENLISGKAAANSELLFPVYGVRKFRFAVALRQNLFSEAVLVLRLYTERIEYLRSEHFRRDVLSSFTKSTPEIAPFLMRLYDEMSDGFDSDTPSIDAGRFILRSTNELRFRYDYPRCGVIVDGTRGCFIRGIPPEALIRILISMFYVADRVCNGYDVTMGAYGSDASIVMTAVHTSLPTDETGVSALIAAAPGCAAAMLAMELTAAKYGFETVCVVRDGIVKFSIARSDETELTYFKSWDQFNNFDEMLSQSIDEMKPILLQQ